MPKGVYIKRAIAWGSDKKTHTDQSGNMISEAQKQVFIEAIEDDCTIDEACAAAKFGRTTYYNYIDKDPDFKLRVEWARSKLIRTAKSKVHLGVDNDETGEFSLKVLKARCPDEYGVQKAEIKGEVKAEVEHKDIDEMLYDFYEE